MALISPASAEIYQSTDAQGNTVYSDKPSQGAQPVDLKQTNSADPVVEKPRPAEPAEPAAPKKVASKPAKPVQRAKDVDDGHYHDNEDYYGYGNINNDGRRDDDDDRKPRKDRPRVEPHRNSSQPASRPAVGGGGRR